MNGEISDFKAYINPAQNILATGNITINGTITPFGYSREINFSLGFNNPF